ncbi:MAG TPA: MFS transporter [Kofleriaceae bacterium]|nr:MFS transporter [Kofleriaceae bacterium]
MIKNRTVILVMLTGLNLLNYIDRMIVAAVLRKIQLPIAEGGLNLSDFRGGLLATAFLGGYFVTSPFFGARADKSARKGLIALGVAIWSIATMGSGLASSFSMMMTARVLVGVGEASYATLAPTIIDDITPPDKKNRALAIFYLAIPVGSALGYVIGGFIAERWGWRAAFYIAGGPGLLLAAACLLIEEPQRKLREAKGNVIDGLRTLAKIPLFRRAVLGYCAYTGAIQAFAFWAPKYLVTTYSEYLNDETANRYFGLITVVSGIVGTVIGGRWADRELEKTPTTVDTPYDAPITKQGTNLLLRICSLGMVWATPLVAICFFMPVPAAFFACAFLAQLGLFLSTSPVNAIGLRAVPPELRASAMAAMIFAIHLFGDLWSPPALGLLKDHLPTVVAMMAVPLVFGWAAYVWWPRASEAK